MKLLDGMARWQLSALGQGGWIAAAFAAQQVLRLLSNILLATLLSPATFGAMVIVNTLRTGGELLTDLGIGQGIINSRHGAEPDFYNTAWTIQIIRGLALFAVGLAITVPVARFYGSDQLLAVIPVASLIFVISGFTMPSFYLLQKDSRVAKLSVFELTLAVISISCQVIFAYVLRDIWGLVLGLLLSNLLWVIGTMFLGPARPRLRFNKRYARQIVGFGKWVFLSSVVFFFSSNFDRLYLAKEIPFALLGIYGIARTYADTLASLMQRATYLIIFPKISASPRRGLALVEIIAKPRAYLFAAIAVGLAAAIALSDALIVAFYDSRYHGAAAMLPILLIATWFSTLGAMSESILLGIGRPSFMAVANLVKLTWVAVTVPLAFTKGGILVAIAFFGAGDAVRYVVLTICQGREGLTFLRQDLACTALFVGSTIAFQEMVYAVGWQTSFGEWLGIGRFGFG